jgi:hypothetical protein
MKRACRGAGRMKATRVKFSTSDLMKCERVRKHKKHHKTHKREKKGWSKF